VTPQIEAFLEMMAVERDSAPNTLAAYGRDLADAEATLGKTGGLMGADSQAVEAWFAGLSQSGLSAATAARRRSAVRQFFRFALSEGWRKDDPSRRLEAPARGRPLPKVLSREEIERLFERLMERDGASALRLLTLVELAYAFLAARGGKMILSQNFDKFFSTLSGSIFILFGILMLLAANSG